MVVFSFETIRLTFHSSEHLYQSPANNFEKRAHVTFILYSL